MSYATPLRRRCTVRHGVVAAALGGRPGAPAKGRPHGCTRLTLQLPPRRRTLGLLLRPPRLRRPHLLGDGGRAPRPDRRERRGQVHAAAPDGEHRRAEHAERRRRTHRRAIGCPIRRHSRPRPTVASRARCARACSPRSSRSTRPTGSATCSRPRSPRCGRSSASSTPRPRRWRPGPCRDRARGLDTLLRRYSTTERTRSRRPVRRRARRGRARRHLDGRLPPRRAARRTRRGAPRPRPPHRRALGRAAQQVRARGAAAARS